MKIGVVSAIAGSSVCPFVKKGEKRTGVEVEGLALSKMFLEGYEKDWKLFLSEKLVDNYDVLMIRGVGYHLQELELLLEYAKKIGVRVVDRGLYDSALKLTSGAKTLTLFKLNERGLSVIPSLYVGSEWRGGFEELGKPPYVLKPAGGRLGQDVGLVKSEVEAQEIIKRRKGLWIAQPYIESEGDVRVLVLGGQVLGAMLRKAVDKTEIRNNVSLGGVAKKIELEDEARGLAVRAAEITNWELAGVDLIKDKHTGKWYILEVNRAPQFKGFEEAAGVDVVESVFQYLINSSEEH